MKITVERKYFAPDYTIGRMYIDGEYFCDTLEDKVRDLPDEKKIRGETAIPAGTYKVALTFSNRFKRVLPLLFNVPFFEGIRIHAGNSKEDTEGCILVGENKVKGKVINSRNYENKLVELMLNEKEISIEIN